MIRSSRILRMLALTRCTLLCLSIASLFSGIASASIIIDPSARSYIEAFSTNNSGLTSREQQDVTSLPVSGNPTASDGGLTSETQYTLSDAGFHFDMDQVGLAINGGTSQSNISIYMTPTTNIDYDISGTYGLTSGGGPIVELSLSIRIGATPNFVYRGIHSSRGIPGETHTLGQSSGTLTDIEEGSLTGTLLAGQQYNLRVSTRILSNLTALDAGTGSGSVDILFTPEPSSALLIGLGLTTLAARKQRPTHD